MNYSEFKGDPQEYVFVIFGIILYFVFRLAQFFFTRKPEHKARLFISRIFYFIEIIYWFGYLAEGIIMFLQKNLVFSFLCGIVLILAIGWVSWFILKDFIAGLFLKMNQSLKLNEIIEFDGFIGKVNHIGSMEVELEINGSNTVKIPYNQFFTKRMIHTGTNENCAKSNFVFKLNPHFNAIEAIETIKVFIYQLPWTSFIHEQDVLIDKMNGDETLIRIGASLFDEKYAERFEKKIRDRFE